MCVLAVRAHGSSRQCRPWHAFFHRLGNAARHRRRELARQVAAMDAFEPGPLRAFERRRKESTASLHAAAARSMGWFETPPLSLAAIDRDAFAYSLVSRSGRIGRAEIASIDPAFLTRVDAGVLGAANNT